MVGDFVDLGGYGYFESQEAGMDPPILALILLALWRAPVWGQRVLALLRDFDDYREQRRLR